MKLHMNKTIFLQISYFVIFTFALCKAQAFEVVMNGPEIGEPQYSIIDNNHVNLASGTLYYKLNDLSIGHGKFALSHSITVSSNELVNFDSYISGYKEKYRGGIRRRVHTNESGPQVTPRYFEVITVSDHELSEDFIINSSGQFEPLSNKTLQLTVDDNHHFVLTKTDGTKVYFYSRSTIPSTISENYIPYASMSKIVYANGFIISIHKDGNNISSKITSVNTNNGLQLKYIYDVGYTPLEASKLSATSNANVINDSLNWSDRFPSRIIALNNAVEICPIAGNSCSPTNEWPEVQYQWPGGMPRAMYIGQSIFTVIDAFGTTTNFHHTAKDTQDGNPQPVQSLIGKYYVPRVTQVENNKGLDITYGSENIWDAKIIAPFVIWTSGGKGILKSATNNGIQTSYNFAKGGLTVDSTFGRRVYAIGNYKSVDYVDRPANKFLFSDARLSAAYEIGMWDKTIHLDQDFANKVTKVESKLNGTTTDYKYDSFGRLKESDWDGLLKKINYPYAYNGICSNYRFCHKPSSVSNRYSPWKGESPEYTTYSYHSSSGQITAIKHPANNQGVNPKKVFSYQQYYARFINSAGNLTTSNLPIWLVSSQFSCKNSDVVNNTSCAGGDKITTTYNYGSGNAANNLFLIGSTLSTEGEVETYRTCYKYDKYGNLIGETQPKAGVTNCNIGREY